MNSGVRESEEILAPGGEEVLPPELTREQARALTDRVKGDAAALALGVLELYEGNAHGALGYASWGDYWVAEFGEAGSRGYHHLQAGRVQRQLGRSTVVERPANEAVARELAPLLDKPELPEVWSQAVQLAEGQPTAAQVRELVRERRVAEPEAAPKAKPPAKPAGKRALANNLHTVQVVARDVGRLPLTVQHIDLAVVRQLVEEQPREDVEEWIGLLKEGRSAINRLLGALSPAG
jgi:hypothetical protein